MKIPINLIHEDAVMPSKAHPTDAGFDLVGISITRTDKYTEYGTGITISIPIGYVGLIFPRSSVSNKRLALANSVGVIDPGYVGELKVRFYNHFHNGSMLSPQHNEYFIGDRVAQLIIIKNEEIEFELLPEAFDPAYFDRGEGGFGSTGI